jgi:hypothetical protein
MDLDDHPIWIADLPISGITGVRVRTLEEVLNQPLGGHSAIAPLSLAHQVNICERVRGSTAGGT